MLVKVFEEEGCLILNSQQFILIAGCELGFGLVDVVDSEKRSSFLFCLFTVLAVSVLASLPSDFWLKLRGSVLLVM